MKKEFEVTGFFYEECGYKCRKFLDIKRLESGVNQPDIMIIMMNPGSSYPLDKIDNNTVVSEAVPDKTQDQIMKVMNGAGFDYARIFNLSDIRTPNSNDLYKFLKSEKSRTFPHSIFDDKRKIEFNTLFVKNTPVIYGWGVNSALNSLVEMAVKTIKCDVPVGIKKDRTEHSYYHPLPRVYQDQVEWVKKVTQMLKFT